MRLILTKEDGRKAKMFMDDKQCLVATAMQREGYTDVEVGGGEVLCVNGSPKKYMYSNETLNRITGAYDQGSWRPIHDVDAHLPMEIELEEVTR